MKKSKVYKLAAGVFKALTILAIFCLLLAYLTPYVHPKTIPFLPFFGLFYPIFLLIAIILLVIYAVARSRWSLVILFFIVIGGNLHFRQFPIGSSKTSEENTEGIKVMSFNVRLFDLYNWSVDLSNKNRIKIFDFLEENSPDVVCFQEFYQQDKNTNFPTRDTLIKRLQTVDFHERYSYKSRGRQHFGIAMLSKYPMISKGEVPLQLEEGEKSDNYCIFADIVKNNDTIRVYNVHLQSIKLKKDDYELFDEQGNPIQSQTTAIENTVFKIGSAYPRRADQAKLVVAHAETSPYPVVICGDFNDTPLSYTYNQFNKVFIDAFREASYGIGSTYAGKIPAGRIDFIFHSDNLEAFDFEIQKSVVSDHRAIWCTISQKSVK
jgi:endonuclease/exonuclease/phosphatase family metal-dependent hydrolase|tara:strand:+ start:22657 stop:23790 length:1134 start_codon:yes stop_codon:yes gene_type:complete